MIKPEASTENKKRTLIEATFSAQLSGHVRQV